MTDEIGVQVRGYVAVFGALLVLTLATVAVSALGAPAFAAGYRPTKPGRADPETPLPE